MLHLLIGKLVLVMRLVAIGPRVWGMGKSQLSELRAPEKENVHLKRSLMQLFGIDRRAKGSRLVS